LITSISAGDLAGLSVLRVAIKERTIPRLSRTFHDRGAPAGELVAFLGSHGYLEIARPGGSAAALLGVATGEPVRVDTINS
jgi:S-adenosylmethionine hydrolase